MRRRAFTLIELLIVVAILALLVSILVPALAHAKELTRAAICMSNMRNWGLGLYYYTNDNNDFLPRRGQGIGGVSDANLNRPEDWFNALPPYVNEKTYYDLYWKGQKPGPGDKSLFICPSADLPASQPKCFFPYAMNIYLSPWNRPLPHNLRELYKPMGLVFMADAPGPFCSTVPAPAAKDYGVVARHTGRANLVFVDGHVETQSGKVLGCGVDIPVPEPDGLHWMTGTDSDKNVPYQPQKQGT